MRAALKSSLGSARGARQAVLPGTLSTAPLIVLPLRSGARAIEEESFPFEAVSDIAEMESWRKEINRPLSHIHKWWAQRLGTVFRAIVIGAMSPKGSDIMSLFYSHVKIQNAVIFDPFMGAGTTATETVKLGSRAIGRDINPVAHFLVRNALAIHDRTSVLKTFNEIAADVSHDMLRFYTTEVEGVGNVPVLYYFWVKTIPCPKCEETIDLFSSYVFAQNAYAKRIPEARAVCPHCGDINKVRYDATSAKCCGCGKQFNPTSGPARGQKAQCPHCSHEFKIAVAIRERGVVPEHRNYAKLVLMPDGRKEYLAVNDFDTALFREAESELKLRKNAFPIAEISPGYNTDQAMGYNYRSWNEFFNARQLLVLSILSERIKKIKEPALKDLFVCLFSGLLEFNNMFASYKGEGTGAVRHMFSHHILKPERTPLEANVWGTNKSSGSFLTMFENRILRALDYAERPFELKVVDSSAKKTTEKVYGLSDPLGYELASTYKEFKSGKEVYLSCGDSSQTDIEDHSVDAVITDPPFFDNVHYSQLADFFHVWQKHIYTDGYCQADMTTRSANEVQNSDVDAFTDRLGSVWKECNRVLKQDGLMVFTYHHSRAEGWKSVLIALMNAGFGIVAAHPVKAEMSVATPKQKTKEPINLDIIIVCRKLETLAKNQWNGDLWGAVTPVVTNQVDRLYRSGRDLSKNDLRIIVMAQILRQLSVSVSTDDALKVLDANTAEIEGLIESLRAPFSEQ